MLFVCQLDVCGVMWVLCCVVWCDGVVWCGVVMVLCGAVWCFVVCCDGVAWCCVMMVVV